MATRTSRPRTRAAPSTSTHPPKVRTAATLKRIERLRRICLALPDATEKEAWAEPTWRVGGKLFAQCATHHHGSPHLAVWLPAPDGAQAALIDANPTHIFRPPYVGHRGWIGVVLDAATDWGEVARLVELAYELIKPAPKRARR